MITRRESFPRGTGAVITIEGDDREEIKAEAERIKAGIDFMRSPSIALFSLLGGGYRAEITYYGLD
jgi:hypothetical protein